ncbi:MAG: winged helix-turn-helix transcriptional regulator [Candidatus Levybacteria bacterium]|nr:winged helix-turn-helix transcriptional regulator [Candidatus Levybacteria bacterium]
MRTDTRENILKYINNQSQTRAADIIRVINITSAMVHRHLRKLEKREVS